ncbi:MAG: methionyl-tRNA formyltransferase [Planctomycetes bacterium]|nr:methionyl-tRNA formyltransferase [Planctomycetota bacterium]MBU1517413.1 methionyl-tRNA formyltransferase [Planctomycetota bacterium]MBU2457773.1 methionyl-tRNA formyltransferase [Planctomycetota bacterium]MBU2596998.1 methionyl-tRNA formyltransferase [Planctomycetota bacterium]
MRIVYCGCGRFGIDSLNALKASSHQFVHIITHPEKQAGRGRKLRANDIAQWAGQNNVSLTTVEDINSSQGVELVKKLGPDLLVVIAFGQKISAEIIGIPPKGAINVHGSLLPKYRGAAPINWALINGETETGISIITLAQKMDAGEILAQDKINIADDNSADIVHDALAKLAAPLLIETIDKIQAGTAVYAKQDNSKATSAPKLKKSDGIIDFNQSARAVHNKVRGLWPWPGATACFVSAGNNKKYPVTISRTKVAEEKGKHDKAGLVNAQFDIDCGTGNLKILELKPHGGKIMDFKSFLNGRASGDGDYFMPLEENGQ